MSEQNPRLSRTEIISLSVPLYFMTFSYLRKDNLILSQYLLYVASRTCDLERLNKKEIIISLCSEMLSFSNIAYLCIFYFTLNTIIVVKKQVPPRIPFDTIQIYRHY